MMPSGTCTEPDMRAGGTDPRGTHNFPCYIGLNPASTFYKKKYQGYQAYPQNNLNLAIP